MRHLRQGLFAALVLSVLAGCQGSYSLVGPGRTEVGDEFSVAPSMAWSQASFGERHLWTINGASLESIWFYAGIADGEALIVGTDDDEDVPRFDADMRPNEVMELILDSLGRAGAVKVEGTGLRPAEFGGTKGYRFELSLQTAEGLMKRGMAIGTVREQKLQFVVYMAADMYYYDTYREEAERIFASLQLI